MMVPERTLLNIPIPVLIKLLQTNTFNKEALQGEEIQGVSEDRHQAVEVPREGLREVRQQDLEEDPVLIEWEVLRKKIVQCLH